MRFNIKTGLEPMLRYIKCEKCGRLRSITQQQVRTYWHGEWPVCCETRMTLLKEIAFDYSDTPAIRARHEKKK